MMNYWFVYYLNETLLVMHRKYCMENIYFNMLFLLFYNNFFVCLTLFSCEAGYTEIFFLIWWNEFFCEFT
jgi:hypothetical protein